MPKQRFIMQTVARTYHAHVLAMLLSYRLQILQIRNMAPTPIISMALVVGFYKGRTSNRTNGIHPILKGQACIFLLPILLLVILTNRWPDRRNTRSHSKLFRSNKQIRRITSWVYLVFPLVVTNLQIH